jgi:hypothetical protein
MRKLSIILVCMLGLLIPNHVEALGNVHISTLSVNIWPEYDQPAVLMIYAITLAPDTTLPASLSIRIPADAQINAVAVMDAANGLINIPFDNTPNGKWSELKMTSSFQQVQVEFYTPLVKKGIARHVAFDWAGDYAIDSLEVNFLKPFGAENVTMSLNPTQTGPGQDGLTNYKIRADHLAAGQSFSLTIDYQRNTDDLSISSLPVQAVATPGPDTPGRVSMTGILPWLLGGIGLLLIIGGIFWFVNWQRSSQVSRKYKKVSVSKHEENDDDFIYCHQCGKRAQPGDVFCRTCGTRLKRSSIE